MKCNKDTGVSFDLELLDELLAHLLLCEKQGTLVVPNLADMPESEFAQLVEDCEGSDFSVSTSSLGSTPSSTNPCTPNSMESQLANLSLSLEGFEEPTLDRPQVLYQEGTSIHGHLCESPQAEMESFPAIAATDKGVPYDSVISKPPRISFTCNSCNRTFTLKGNLTRHQNYKEGCKMGEIKPYPCEYCGEVFFRADKCAEHEQKIHGQTQRSRRIIKDV